MWSWPWPGPSGSSPCWTRCPRRTSGYRYPGGRRDDPDRRGWSDRRPPHRPVGLEGRPHRTDGTITYTPLAGEVVFDHVDFGYVAGQAHPPRHPALRPSRGRRSPSWAPPARARPPSPTSSTASTTSTDGKIRYDGININKIRKADLRRSLGMVLQDTHLFTGTVMDNIRYGRLDATDEECIAAAKLANADGFIRRLPRRVPHPAHRRRRPTSARASGSCWPSPGRPWPIPPVLILDEATSSIDTRTEALVQAGHGPPHGRADHLRHRPPALHRAATPTASWSWSRAGSSSGAATTELLPPRRAATTSSTPAASRWPNPPRPFPPQRAAPLG